MDKNRLYAGVGSRKTPPTILRRMTELAQQFAKRNWTLRSGGAEGADLAFEAGASHKEIYRASDATPAAIEMAAKYHPAWDRCSPFVRKLHGRNNMIMLGKDLTVPVKMVICWTPGGLSSGGTGQAIRVAQAHDIPVVDMGSRVGLQQVLDKLDEWTS